MKFGITAKLFLAVLATNVTIAIALGFAERVSFNHGFRDYVRQREAERVASLAEKLAAVWRTEGSFESLRNNEAAWQQLARANHDFGGPPPFPPGSARDRDFGGPRPFPRDDARARDAGSPPRFPDEGGRPREFGDPPPFPHEGGPPRARPAEWRGPPPRPPAPALLDAAKRRVVGGDDLSELPVLRPIAVDGVTVGWLAGGEMREPFSGAERQLQEQQAKASWIIGGLAVLLAAAVAYLLARGFLAPLKRLADATHRIAAGEYTTRVEATSADELGQLVADFNRLAKTLEANESLRRHFMADVSHELRTPLAILRGELEALEDGIRKLTPDLLRSLQAEVATLGKLVEDLYDLSLADVGALKFRMQDLDAVALVDTALGAFQDRFAARAITVQAALRDRAPIAIVGDPQRLTQLLNNLFENSARYTDPGGRMTVAVERADGRVHIDVMDSAPGVPAASLPTLFERLYRVEGSRNRASGGAGLGLALCRSIVTGHEGEIAAVPSPLGGLWVRVTLPAKPGDNGR